MTYLQLPAANANRGNLPNGGCQTKKCGKEDWSNQIKTGAAKQSLFNFHIYKYS